MRRRSSSTVPAVEIKDCWINCELVGDDLDQGGGQQLVRPQWVSIGVEV
jgi:hypothetical protein